MEATSRLSLKTIDFFRRTNFEQQSDSKRKLDSSTVCKMVKHQFQKDKYAQTTVMFLIQSKKLYTSRSIGRHSRKLKMFRLHMCSFGNYLSL